MFLDQFYKNIHDSHGGQLKMEVLLLNKAGHSVGLLIRIHVLGEKIPQIEKESFIVRFSTNLF